MPFSRTQIVAAATVAALSVLSVAAFAAGSGDPATPAPAAAAPAPTTPLVEERTAVVEKVVHRTKHLHKKDESSPSGSGSGSISSTPLELEPCVERIRRGHACRSPRRRCAAAGRSRIG